MKEIAKKALLCLLPLLLIMTLVCGCNGESQPQKTLTEIADVKDGVRVGTIGGTLGETLCRTRLTDCPAQYFNTLSDTVSALMKNKIDVCLTDDIIIDSLLKQIDGVACLPGSLCDQQIGAVFCKTDDHAQEIRREFNAFIADIEKDGTLETLRKGWIENSDQMAVNTDIPTGTGGTLTGAFVCNTEPINYMQDGKPAGLEIDLFYRFCAARGYTPEMKVLDFSGVLASVTTGKCDIGFADIAMNDERKQSVDFSDPYLTSGYRMLVRAQSDDTGFFAGLAKSFYKTFVVESRWKLILHGLGNTLLISLCSAVAGTLFGFIIYLICRKHTKIAGKIFDFLSWIIGSLPTVILLMVMYYILFGSSSVSGIWVSTVAFSVSTSLSVYSALAAAVRSIDAGQLEGAYSLGFTDMKTFLQIILPQAMRQFIPAYKGILVSLVQGTAIVGYIAVEDLTKMSDIIRGRTYEAFFPIIACALIYLILCWLLTLLIRIVQIRVDPQARSAERILKRFSK